MRSFIPCGLVNSRLLQFLFELGTELRLLEPGGGFRGFHRFPGFVNADLLALRFRRITHGSGPLQSLWRVGFCELIAQGEPSKLAVQPVGRLLLHPFSQSLAVRFRPGIQGIGEGRFAGFGIGYASDPLESFFGFDTAPGLR